MLKRLFALLTLLLPNSVFAQEISQVSVLDANFQPVKTLTSADDLAAFEQLWSSKKVQGSQLKTEFPYKLIIQQRGRRGGRWLYDPTGFVQILAMNRTPVYALSDREAFNQLLGIHLR